MGDRADTGAMIPRVTPPSDATPENEASRAEGARQPDQRPDRQARDDTHVPPAYVPTDCVPYSPDATVVMDRVPPDEPPEPGAPAGRSVDDTTVIPAVTWTDESDEARSRERNETAASPVRAVARISGVARAATPARAVARPPVDPTAEPPAGGLQREAKTPAAKGAARVLPPPSRRAETTLNPGANADTAVIRRVPTAGETTIIPRVDDGDVADPATTPIGRARTATAITGSVTAANAESSAMPSGPASRTAPGGLGQAPWLLTLSACGVVLVAIAYSAGRTGAPWANAAYWAAQVLIFAPVAARMFFSRLAGSVESFTLVIGLAVMQYMQKWLYSPEQFRFPDELQHWAAANTVVQTGRLFQPDRALPVAVHFPGLEVMTSAVVSLTGLPITAAGLIVAGVAHLTFVGLLFAVIRRTGGSPELAGAACILYATALHYVFFDSMFIYQTAALPFMMLGIWASRMWQPREWKTTLPYAIVALISIVGTTASHHVTAAVLVATLGLIGLCEVLFTRPRRWATLVMAMVAAAIVASWFVFVAPEVFGYLGPPLEGMVSGLSALLGGGPSGDSAPASPKWQLAVQALGLIVLLLLLIRAAKQAWRSPERVPAWTVALIVGALMFFASTGARFVGAQGPELAGRASTFAYIPMSIVAAGILVGWRPRPHLPRRPHLDQIAMGRGIHPIVHGTFVALLLMVGARLGGWPPTWEALPGPYLVSAYERSVDPRSVAAAQWTSDWLGPDHRVAADQGGINVVSTLGDQDPVGEASKLYYDAAWNLDDELMLQSLGIDYLWVDIRISQQLPASGAYFPVDPQNGLHTTPIPRANLTKFDGVSGANRVYDNGDIRIYDMRTA
jgi:hypothetical protein